MQRTFFDTPPTSKPAYEITPVAAVERKRLSKQCEAILAMLRLGRVTNAELSTMALKYSGRISEIRQAGHNVRVVEHNRKTGLAVYALFVDGVEVSSQ